MTKTADVIIVGAGVIGLCTALQIAKRSNLQVTVLEKGRSLGEGSSGASSAICRHLYTHDEMVCLARDGIDVYKSWKDFLETDETPNALFQQEGVLWMGSESERWDREHVERLARLGVVSEVLDDDDLVKAFPAINPRIYVPDFETGETLDSRGAGAHLVEIEAGYMDPQYVLEDLAASLADRGIRVLRGQEVNEILVERGRAIGVACTDDIYHGDMVINASGPWCNSLLDGVGLAETWPLTPTRIQVLYMDRPEELQGHIPVCADIASGIYFRTQNQGRQLIVGSTSPDDETEAVDDPDEYDKLTDEDFRIHKLHALHHRLPALPYRGRIGGYSGLYTVNRKDMHPVLGPCPVEGLIVANGFSGHGFKLAPAVGSLLAQTVTGTRIEGDTEVPIEFLGWDRQPISLTTHSVLA